MNILATFTTPTGQTVPHIDCIPGQRRSKDLALAGAFRIVASDLRGFLANLGMLTEVAKANSYCRSLAGHQPASRATHDLLQRLDDIMTSVIHNTRRTGDPFGFRSGLVDLQDILGLALSLNRPLAENKGVRLLAGGAGPVTLTGDRRLLLQAADALVAQAVRRSPANGRITCLAERRQDLILLHVTDAGETLTDARSARLLSPFASAPGPQHRAGPVELEPWFARLIAERHGGRLTASAPVGGRGNQFTLALPAELR